VDADRYVELSGDPGTSLNGLQLVVIGDLEGQFPPAQNGGVEIVVPLSGSIGSSGRFVVATSSYTLGAADLLADLPFEQGDNLTVIIADGYAGSPGDDVDVNETASSTGNPAWWWLMTWPSSPTGIPTDSPATSSTPTTRWARSAVSHRCTPGAAKTPSSGEPDKTPSVAATKIRVRPTPPAAEAEAAPKA
jgi:hypothetical protein